jgi:hypothetical protein
MEVPASSQLAIGFFASGGSGLPDDDYQPD